MTARIGVLLSSARAFRLEPRPIAFEWLLYGLAGP
jgi:hypothetical protein